MVVMFVAVVVVIIFVAVVLLRLLLAHEQNYPSYRTRQHSISCLFLQREATCLKTEKTVLSGPEYNYPSGNLSFVIFVVTVVVFVVANGVVQYSRVLMLAFIGHSMFGFGLKRIRDRGGWK